LYPVLLWHPRVTSYGVMLAAAWLVGWFLARRRAAGLGVPVWHIDGLMPLLVLGTFAGARLAGHLVQQLSPGSSNDHLLLGGLVAAVVVVVVQSRWTRVPLGQLGDAFAFSLPAGIVLLRVGCFLAGCCWGNVCSHRWPLGVTYPTGSPAYYQHLLAGWLPAGADRSLPVHPLPLYEAAAVLALLAALVLLDRYWRRWGESFLAFGLGYCVLRFLLEWLRADRSPLAYGLGFSQLASLTCAAGCLILWVARYSSAARGRHELYRRQPRIA
jgi:phosphatidylglycerol---prolipoprotein diacylglyceryl transferase